MQLSISLENTHTQDIHVEDYRKAFVKGDNIYMHLKSAFLKILGTLAVVLKQHGDFSSVTKGSK